MSRINLSWDFVKYVGNRRLSQIHLILVLGPSGRAELLEHRWEDGREGPCSVPAQEAEELK